MIGRVAGRVLWRAEDHVLIDVRGVGYLVYCSDRTLMGLPPVGEAAALFTELLVREDLLQLYGFVDPVEKEWFRLLMTVQGVGAKAAIAILGALGQEGIGRAIALGDVAAIKAARGIGPKTAQRVVIELKDKAPGVMALSGRVAGSAAPVDDDALIEADGPPPAAAGSAGSAAPARPAAGARGNAAAQSDALSALTNLGYGPSDAAAAIARAAEADPQAATAALIRAALQQLAPKG